MGGEGVGWVAEGWLSGWLSMWSSGSVQAHGERAGQRGAVAALWRRCGGAMVAGGARACETPSATMEATSVVCVTTELATSTEVA